MTKVQEDQFEVRENSVVHRPTGAEFTAYPGHPEFQYMNWGRAGEVLPNGDDFDRDEVEKVAAKLLASRPSLSSRPCFDDDDA
jgi:predicted secreted protein